MSDGWQWFFNIIGMVAFLMAFPFVLQLIFGQPKIGFVFSIDDYKVRLSRRKSVNKGYPVLDATLMPFENED